MSALTDFRDHARKMANTPGDAVQYKPQRYAGDPDCWAFPTDTDRALWTRLADEIDAYLTEGPDLREPTDVEGQGELL